MTKETRIKLGKDFKEGKTKNYEAHYLANKEEIDKLLEVVEVVEKKKGAK